MKRFFLSAMLIWLVFSEIYSQDNAVKKGLEVLSEQAVKAQLDFLASDWMEGRETGEKGIDMAADYIASMFQVYGLLPAEFQNGHEGFAGRGNRSGGAGSGELIPYFQEFALMKTEKSDDHELAVITETSGTRKTTRFAYSNDFSFMSRPVISQEGEFPVVFVGYGLVKKEENYDDYAGVNVKGKVVVRLIGFPGHRDTASTAYKKFHSDGNEWTKYREELDRNDLAEGKGAVAVIVVNTTRDITLDFAKNVFRYNFGDYEGDVPPVSSHTNRMYFPSDTVSKSIPAFSATHRIANELTTGTKVSLESFEKQVQETMKPDSRELRDKRVYFRQTVKTSVIAARNVLGMIEGKNPNEIVVVGAHYDHLGKYDGIVYNGSDDNASGTVAVMSIARSCMATGIKPERTLIFAAWTAEEKGLLGSEFFVEHPPAGKIIAYLNYDMISRNEDTDSSGVKCSMTYTQSFSALEDISRKVNEQYGLGLQIQYKPRETPTGGSDHNAFVHKNIPVFYYMAGWHDDYHKPGDHPEKANIEKMTRIAKLGFLSVWDIANGDGLRAGQ